MTPAEGRRPLTRSSVVQALGRWLSLHKWTLIGVVWIATLLIGAAGFWLYYGRPRAWPALLDILYLTAQLFVLQSGAVDPPLPTTLQVARFAAPAITTVTVLQAIGAIFAEQFELVRLRRMRHHLVICGLGWVGWLLVREKATAGESVVVVEKHPGNLLLKDCRANGATVLIGDASEEFTLRRAGIERAQYLVAATGQDGQNVQIALAARRVLQRHKHSLDCYVHIVDRQLCTLLAAQEIERENPSDVHIEFFNIFESGARVLVDKHPPQPIQASAAGPAHVLLVGLGELGSALLVELAYRQWRNPGCAPLRVTVAAADARRQVASLQATYPRLGEYCSIGYAEPDPARRRRRWPRRAAHDSFSIAYVCEAGDSEVLSNALDLYEHRRRRGQPAIPIIACLTREDGLAELVRSAGACTDDFQKVAAFGLLDGISQPEKLLVGAAELLARNLRRNETGLVANDADWISLREAARAPYRRRAREILGRLDDIGCRVSPLRDWRAPWVEFTEADLAVLIHGAAHPEAEKAALNDLGRILADEGLALYRCRAAEM